MKASEAFAAWLDGTPVDVLISDTDWGRVTQFSLGRCGLEVTYHNGIQYITDNKATYRKYRVMP